MDRANSYVNEMKKQMEDSDHKVGELTATLDDLKAENVSLKAELAAMKKTVDSLEEKLDESAEVTVVEDGDITRAMASLIELLRPYLGVGDEEDVPLEQVHSYIDGLLAQIDDIDAIKKENRSLEEATAKAVASRTRANKDLAKLAIHAEMWQNTARGERDAHLRHNSDTSILLRDILCEWGGFRPRDMRGINLYELFGMVRDAVSNSRASRGGVNIQRIKQEYGNVPPPLNEIGDKSVDQYIYDNLKEMENFRRTRIVKPRNDNNGGGRGGGNKPGPNVNNNGGRGRGRGKKNAWGK